MIIRYRFAVQSSEALMPSRAYAFYSCLMSALPEEVADWLHAQGETPVSQFLYYDRQLEKNVWQLTLLGKTAVNSIAPALDSLTQLDTNIGPVMLRLLERKALSAAELIAAARSSPIQNKVIFRFLSPVAFRQNGHYSVLPEARLILQSLINKWNATFPEYPLNDEDAGKMLLENVWTADVNIRSTRYPLKNVQIPGIVGSITVKASLSPPIMELWNLLARFSAFSGIGIKTSLGMGGVSLAEPGTQPPCSAAGRSSDVPTSKTGQANSSRSNRVGQNDVL